MQPTDIKTVIALFRVSTEDQATEGNSLEAQHRMFEMDCEAFKWKSLATYSGHETGTSLDARRIINDVLDAIRQHRPDAFWVREQSRLTRGDQLDVAYLLRELRESGTCVVTERGHVIDLDDIEGEFVFSLKAIIDRREYQVIQRRCQLGQDEKANRGLLASGRPAYGYKVVGAGKEKGQRVPHTDESPNVRLIFELAAAGTPVKEISRKLHRQGVKPPTSVGRESGVAPKNFEDGLQTWAPTTLKRMLKNPLYYGVSYRHCWVRKGASFVFDRSNPNAIWIENAHDPIVSRELFEAARQQIEKRVAQRGTLVHMLTGVLCCPVCGSPVRCDGKTGRQYYLCCRKRNVADVFGRRCRSGGACTAKYLRLDETDRLMWDGLVRAVADPDLVADYLQKERAENLEVRIKRELSLLEKERHDLDRKVTIAREKLLTEVLTDAEYLSVKKTTDSRIRKLDRQIDNKRHEAATTSVDLAKRVLSDLATLRLGERKFSNNQRATLFRGIVRKITPNDGTLRVCEFQLNCKLAPVLVENAFSVKKTTRTEDLTR